MPLTALNMADRLARNVHLLRLNWCTRVRLMTRLCWLGLHISMPLTLRHVRKHHASTIRRLARRSHLVNRTPVTLLRTRNPTRLIVT